MLHVLKISIISTNHSSGGPGIIFSKSGKRENHLQVQDVIIFIGNSRAMNFTNLYAWLTVHHLQFRFISFPT
jgi:hypothetical protein